MPDSPDLEQKVTELEGKVKKLEFSLIATLLIVFLLFIFNQGLK
ncbi:MAG: hypothetical protein ACOZFS_03730 [Thermodesulfobacteriota bacterium]